MFYVVSLVDRQVWALLATFWECDSRYFKTNRQSNIGRETKVTDRSQCFTSLWPVCGPVGSCLEVQSYFSKGELQHSWNGRSNRYVFDIFFNEKAFEETPWKPTSQHFKRSFPSLRRKLMKMGKKSSSTRISNSNILKEKRKVFKGTLPNTSILSLMP